MDARGRSLHEWPNREYPGVTVLACVLDAALQFAEVESESTHYATHACTHVLTCENNWLMQSWPELCTTKQAPGQLVVIVLAGNPC